MAQQKLVKMAVIPDDNPPAISGTPAEDLLRAISEEVAIYTEDRPEPDELVKRCKDADAVINIRSVVQFPRSVLERLPKLKILSIWAVGVDNVDLEACKELGITATRMAPLSAPSVAEHSLAMAMAVSRKLVPNDQMVRRGEWGRPYVTDLLGKTMGIIGTGPIGQRVAQLAKGIGMNVVAYTINPSPERAREYGVEFVELDDLLRQSDVIVTVIAVSSLTENMIGAREFGLMKPTAILVNTGRGLLVDEAALADALNSGRIAGAGVDVFVNEPIEPESPLLKVGNIILSPHMAANTPDGALKRLLLAVENIQWAMEGNPQNVLVQGNRI